MGNKNKTVLLTILTSIVFLSLITATYAFLRVGINNTNNMKTSITTGTVRLTFSDGNPGFSAKLGLEETVKKELVVENLGTQSVEFEILLKNYYNSFNDNSISCVLEYSTSKNGEYSSLKLNDEYFNIDGGAKKNINTYASEVDSRRLKVLNANKFRLTSNSININSNSTYYFNFIIKYNNLEDVDQTNELNNPYIQFSTLFDIKEVHRATNMLKEMDEIFYLKGMYEISYYPTFENEENVSYEMFTFLHRPVFIGINNTLDIPDNATKTWDISSNQDGSIIAYAIPIEQDNNTFYLLGWSSNSQIVCNPNSQYLFAYISIYDQDLDYENLTEEYTTSFLGDLDTSLIEDASFMFMGTELSMFLNTGFITSSRLNDTSGMFYGCMALGISLDNLNLSNVKSMQAMFMGTECEYNINFNIIDTRNVEDMSYMFYSNNINFNNGILTLPINTSNVKNMSYMFAFCSLEELDLSYFDTSEVTNMEGLVYRCDNLTSLDLSNFNTSNVINFSLMFWECNNLSSLNLNNFNTLNAINMAETFYGCKSLTSLDLSNFNTTNVTDMTEMFKLCENLTSLDLSNFDTSKVTSMELMFEYCGSLTILNINTFDTSNVTNMWDMFDGCHSLTSLDLSNFNTSNVITMSGMFGGCYSLTSIDLSNFDTSNVTDMNYMFYGCSSLTDLNVSNFDTSNVTVMYSMFSGCSSLISIDLNNFDTSKVTHINSMFRGCNNLKTVNLSSFNTSNVTYMSYMFYGCQSLTSLDLSNFNTSNVIDMYSMFDGCSNLVSLHLSSFDTSNVTDMRYMFDGCSNLVSLDLNNFDTSNVDNMRSMFRNCYSLKIIYVSNLWNTSLVTSSTGMFTGCINLVGGAGTTYNSSYVDISRAHIDEGPTNPGYFTLKV